MASYRKKKLTIQKNKRKKMGASRKKAARTAVRKAAEAKQDVL